MHCKSSRDHPVLSVNAIGNNGQGLAMFSPFPWRRIILMDISGDISTAAVTSVALDQDMEFLTDVYYEPTTTTAYAIGNSQRGLPVVLQFDTLLPFETWGVILAGICNQDGPSGAGMGSYCHWAPYGRFSRSVALDIHPSREKRMYIGLATIYCVHCQDWEEDDKFSGSSVAFASTSHRARCKEGKQEEDYYDNDSYCLQEEWNTRTMAWRSGLTTAEMDQLSGKNWGENASVAIMQLGEIPKIGGVAAASMLAPAVWGAGAWAVAAALMPLLR